MAGGLWAGSSGDARGRRRRVTGYAAETAARADSATGPDREDRVAGSSSDPGADGGRSQGTLQRPPPGLTP